MLLHIGENVSIPLSGLLFIVNERGITPRTRAFIERAKEERRYMHAGGKPKCYAVVREHNREVVYESMLASSTLEKRLHDETTRKYLTDRSVVIVEDT